MTAEQRWVARCPEYTSTLYVTEAQAKRKTAALSHMGCTEDHVVVELVQDRHGRWRDPDGRLV